MVALEREHDRALRRCAFTNCQLRWRYRQSSVDAGPPLIAPIPNLRRRRRFANRRLTSHFAVQFTM